MCVMDYSAMLFFTTVAMPVSGFIWGFLLYKLIVKSLGYKARQLMGNVKAGVLG